VEARAAVLEFFLLNHPLDCPVCDKGGECPLQDYANAFGPSRSRMEFPRREFDGSGVQADVDFGPTLLLNRNRCILCTRCVRFMRDVDGDPQIAIINRGSESEIGTFQETGVRSLLSGNLMDVCPVGAITTRDYRFRSRPWDNPLVVDTICTRCSKGCSTSAWIKAKPEWAKGPQLARFTPRLAPEVNGYWMCDIGRFDYHWIEGSERLRVPLARGESGQLEPSSWDVARARVSEALTTPPGNRGRVVWFLLSAHASLEEMFLVRQLGRGLGLSAAELPVAVSWSSSDKHQPADTKFRVAAIDAPNVRGAWDLGLLDRERRWDEPDLSRLRRAVEAGEVEALYVFDPGPAGSIGDVSWLIEARQARYPAFLAVHGVIETELARAADVVLPGATSVEKTATYVNDQGRVQAVSRVISPPGEARDDWQTLVELARSLGVAPDFTSAMEIRTDIARTLADQPAYRQIAHVGFHAPVAARTWLQLSNPSERWKWDFLFQAPPPIKSNP
jgi:NADH-quinone oxidoreductase subunit G